jgi:hypothetical protein
LSTLNDLGFVGITASAASATSAARASSCPYCLEAMAGRKADARASFVSGLGNENVESSDKR